MIKPARQTLRRFLVGEAVRSLFHGLGRVVRCGLDPAVQFMGGPRLRVPGDTLRIVNEEQFDEETANREAIERFLDIYMFGHTTRQPPALPQMFDLEEALRRDTLPDLSQDEAPLDSGSLLFVMDDLNGETAQSDMGVDVVSSVDPDRQQNQSRGQIVSMCAPLCAPNLQ